MRSPYTFKLLEGQVTMPRRGDAVARRGFGG
jgi:hypothetical protein